MRTSIKSALATAVLLGLSACGGSGGNAVSKVPVLSADPTGDMGQMVSAQRAAYGLAPVRRSSKLEVAARNHAIDMARRGYFSHTSKDGRTVLTRVQKQRYRPCLVSENIAMGVNTKAEVVQAWMDSPGHRVNMLSPRSREFGAYGVLDAETQSPIWVIVFGEPGC